MRHYYDALFSIYTCILAVLAGTGTALLKIEMIRGCER